MMQLGCLRVWGVLAFFVSVAIAQHEQIPLLSSTDPQGYSGGPTTRLAIIGAGSAGSSTAYHLSRFAAVSSLDLDLTIFEKSSYVGGRSTTVHVLNDPAYPVELGASIFVRVNEILYSTAQELGLSTDGVLSEEDPEADYAFGVWDGTKFVYVQPKNGLGWWDMTKLLWRYGTAPIKTRRLMNETVSSFLDMYHAPVFPWTSLSEAAEQTGLLEFTSSTGWQALRKNGIGDLWSGEIIQSSTRVNYGQNLATIHGLESMVCMATDDAMSIRGGNWRIFDGMVKASRAKVRLNTTVTSVHEKLSNEEPYAGQKVNQVCWKSADDTDSNATCEEFDIVVLAAPAQFSNIDFGDLADHDNMPDEISYVSLYVTLLATPHRLSPQFFGLDDNQAESSLPSMIITTLPPSAQKGPSDTGVEGVGPAGIWSVNRIRGIHPSLTNNLNQTLHVYKIFSPAPINATFLSSMFNIPDTSDVSPRSSFDHDPLSTIPHAHLPWYHTKHWHSYPYLFPRVTFEELRLDADAASPDVQGSLWYTSGIESFISTMETSALAGKNVARLIVDRAGIMKEAVRLGYGR